MEFKAKVTFKVEKVEEVPTSHIRQDSVYQRFWYVYFDREVPPEIEQRTISTAKKAVSEIFNVPETELLGMFSHENPNMIAVGLPK